MSNFLLRRTRLAPSTGPSCSVAIQVYQGSLPVLPFGLEYLSYRNLGGARRTRVLLKPQVKAFAAEAEVPAEPDEEGNTHDDDGSGVSSVQGKPSDQFVPVPSPTTMHRHASANNGAPAARSVALGQGTVTGYHGTFKQLLEGLGGPEYIYSILIGYQDPPAEGC